MLSPLSPFTSSQIPGPVLLPVDEESGIGRFANWTHEQYQIPCWGFVVALLVDSVMIFFKCFGCEFVQTFDREFQNRVINHSRQADWPLTEEAILRAQEAVARTLTEHYKPFAEVPTLDLGNEVGNTGYIDFLTCDRLTAPVMKGVDCMNRPFVALDLTYTESGQRRPFVLFQRYCDNDSWVDAGGFFQARPLVEGHSLVSEENLAAIARVLRGEHPDYRLNRSE